MSIRGTPGTPARLIMALVSLLLAGNVSAADADADSTVPTESTPAPIRATDNPAPPKPAETVPAKTGTSADAGTDFSPTEEISEDFAVSFPVDI